MGRNVPAAGMGFKWGDAAVTRRSPAGDASGQNACQAMSMRAAEAIVSKAPKAMKTFPIKEV